MEKTESSITKKRQRGFTLIEVIVALIILGTSITIIFQLFSGCLKGALILSQYDRAVLLAREKLNNYLIKDELDTGSTEGRDNGFSWEVNITKDKSFQKEFEKLPLELFLIEVSVIFPDQKRKIELKSLKTVINSEEFGNVI
ncbi:MAG: type II secretion system protein [Thermodesulfobacteriota bacterium]|nr:type II secretion system protein [Thermodesulfobacteriota bacterium]